MICPVVAAAAAEGFDIDELRAHMLGCEICRPILGDVMAVLRPAFDAALTEDQDDDDDDLLLV